MHRWDADGAGSRTAPMGAVMTHGRRVLLVASTPAGIAGSAAPLTWTARLNPIGKDNS
jgi:hypothetical protein